MKIYLPEKVSQIINCIRDAGYEAYAVGGCIRDSILGRVPDDWDITTSATPQQVKALFRRTVDTGIQHGTVTVLLDKEGFEVTTYRIDGKYEDGRHPTEVTFTPSLAEDLRRRDFTINAMAYNEEHGLVDLFGGLADMEAGVIRCVGEATERFTEDALRIMRAIRFSAQLGYIIEEKTRAAAAELAENLRKISAERIQVELVKLLRSPHPEAMCTVYETGAAAVILPEWQELMETAASYPCKEGSLGEHALRVLQLVENGRELRLAALLQNIGDTCRMPEKSEEQARAVLRRLKFDNDTAYTVCKLIKFRNVDWDTTPTREAVRRSMNAMGQELMPLMLRLRQAEILSLQENVQEQKLAVLASWQEQYESICEAGECVSLKTLAVTGSDLIALGMKPGRELGTVLQELLELVLQEPARNEKEYLLAWVLGHRKE